MSHVVCLEIEFSDLSCLSEACANLGLTFDKNATEWKWFGEWVNDYHENDAAYKHGITPDRCGCI